MGRDLYLKFFRGYTRKQWGLDPSALYPSVTARVPTRTNRDDRYFADTYQAMPRHGYTRMFEKMLGSPDIKIMLNTDYREIVDLVPWQHMIYTGPIDAFFHYRYGKLPYRSLEFRHVNLPQEQFQPVGTVNLPELLRLHADQRVQAHHGAEAARARRSSTSTPKAEGDPYYPVPSLPHPQLDRRYEQQTPSSSPTVTFVGRLATYKYYNMDQVVGQALVAFKRLQKTLLPRPVEIPLAAAPGAANRPGLPVAAARLRACSSARIAELIDAAEVPRPPSRDLGSAQCAR